MVEDKDKCHHLTKYAKDNKTYNLSLINTGHYRLSIKYPNGMLKVKKFKGKDKLAKYVKEQNIPLDLERIF